MFDARPWRSGEDILRVGMPISLVLLKPIAPLQEWESSLEPLFNSGGITLFVGQTEHCWLRCMSLFINALCKWRRVHSRRLSRGD